MDDLSFDDLIPAQSPSTSAEGDTGALPDLNSLEQRYNLPSGLLSSVMHQESGGDPNAISDAGAQGLFQFMPRTAKQYGIDPFDPNQAAEGAARMYSDLSKKYNGDVPSMLAGYNWGQGNVDRKGLANAPKETRNYINSVMGGMGSSQPEMRAAPLDLASDNFDVTPSEANNISFDDLIPQGSGGSDLSFDDLTPKYSADPARAAYQATMGHIAKPINSAINAITSPVVNAMNSAAAMPAQKASDAIDSTDTGQWLGDKLLETKNAASNIGGRMSSSLRDLESYSPDLEKDISALGENAELAGNIPIIKPIAGVAAGALNKAGEVIADAGVSQAQNIKNNFVKDLISPKPTQNVLADQFSRSTEQGLLKSRVVQPTAQEAATADAVSQLPVSKNNSLLKNYNIIDDANTAEARNLSDMIKKNDVAIPDDTIINTLSDVRDNLAKNPYIVGDGAKAAENVVNSALDIISQNPQTASGLLQSRKQLDQLVSSQKGVKTFNPTLDSPITNAVQQVRQAINGMVHDAVPTADVRASLAKQSSYYRALENIESKGALEPSNLISRAAQKVSNMIPVKSALSKVAVLGAGAGAAAYAPVLAGVALAGYGGAKALTSPFLKRAIGNTLKVTGNQMKGFAKGGLVNENPTDAQKEAGNYKKHHIKLHGIDIAIQNPNGSIRSGKDKTGKEWQVKMPAHYGYFKGTTGRDGDAVDVYVGEKPHVGRVYMIHQVHDHNGKFDEHKAMLGFSNKAEALDHFKRAFSDGKGSMRIGSVKGMSVQELKDWLKKGNTRKQVA